MAGKAKMLDIVSTVVVSVAAVVMVGFYIYDRQSAAAPGLGDAPLFIDNWEEENELGIWIGPEDARMVITEFMDFTCPYCRQLAPVVDSFMTAHPNDVALVFQHFPLGRSNSTEAAVVAECADRQEAFHEMYLLLYERMDEYGVTPWVEFAEDAGVQDPTAFQECVDLPVDSFTRIAAGRELGERTGARGTPTVWVNGDVRVIRSVEGFEEALEALSE